jgi:hypothetical protein
MYQYISTSTYNKCTTNRVIVSHLVEAIAEKNPDTCPIYLYAFRNTTTVVKNVQQPIFQLNARKYRYIPYERR